MKTPQRNDKQVSYSVYKKRQDGSADQIMKNFDSLEAAEKAMNAKIEEELAVIRAQLREKYWVQED